MTIALAVVGLVLPVLLGGLGGALRLFDDPDAAVGHLNRFALTFGFPALIFVGLAKSQAALPTSAVFWVVVPASVLLAILPLRKVGTALGGHAGTMALVTAFGNVAYLGLPVVQAVFGEAVMPTASLLVGVYVFVSLTVGPVLLLAWSGGDAASGLLRSAVTVAKQPLFWSPVLGVASRALPDEARAGLVTVLTPLGHAAAPVALFLLGLYLHTHRSRLRQVDRVVVAHVTAKGIWLPLVTAVVVLLTRDHGLGTEAARVVLLLSAMPPAITTFAIARELQVGAERVAQTIVAGSAVALVTVPLTAWLASGL